MNQSSTPRTDAHIKEVEAMGLYCDMDVVTPDFARALERENARLRMALEPFAREWKTWRGKSSKAVMICEAGFSPTEAEFTQDDLERAELALANNVDMPSHSEE